MNLAERLRSVVRPGGAAPRDLDSVGSSCAATELDGEWRESGGHRYLTIDRRYPFDHRLGRVSVGSCLPGSAGIWPTLSLLTTGEEAARVRGPLLFVDLETTGLAGGAGTYAFLVGCGWFEDSSFRVRQFFLTSYAVEPAVLAEVAALVAAAGTVVTYNGKTFDLPLIDTRFLFHRRPSPFGGAPHVDMLHPARRLWRQPSTVVLNEWGSAVSQGSCRLSLMEESVLGHTRRGDVPGVEIPARYFHFVRTGDATPLGVVCEHNRLDLLALAMLTATAASLLAEGPHASRTAREALGLGQLYERGGLIDQALACYERAARLRGNPLVEAEALRAYGMLCRRVRNFEAAAGAWGRLLKLPGCPPHLLTEATEALAVHHEHRSHDLHTARLFALQSLQCSKNTTRRESAQHRVSRLERKLAAREVASPAPLLSEAQ